MRRAAIALLIFLVLGASPAMATPTPTPTATPTPTPVATCLLSGTIADIYGQVGSPVKVSYQGVSTQNASAAIIPGGSRCSIFTTATGALPTTGVCTSFVQGAKMTVQIGEAGQPVQVQVPYGPVGTCSTDLSSLILANSDPPSIVTNIAVSPGGDYILNVTNPALGSVGPSVLGPGNVTGWAGQAIPTAVPSSGVVPNYVGGHWVFTPNVTLTANVNTVEGIAVTNSSAANTATGQISFTNDTGKAGWMTFASSTYNAQGPAIPAGSLQLGSTGVGGIVIATDFSVSPGPPLSIWTGSSQTAIFQQINGGGVLVLPNGTTTSVYFGPPPNPYGTITALGAGNLSLNAGAHDNGVTWIADSAGISSLSLTGNRAIFYSGSGNTVGGTATNTAVAQFIDSPPGLSGLMLGGYSAGINANYGIPAIGLGNVSLSGTGWANLNICGACAPNNGAGAWIADGGAGSGLSLFQVGPGGVQTAQLLWAGPTSGGSVVAWNQNTYWLPSGMNVTHIQNAQSYGVPTCVNCASLNNGSRDTSGYLQITGTWPITINFAKAFTGTVACTGAALGGPGMIWFANNTTTSIQVTCTLPGGAVCSTSPTAWISYHCFGNGA